MRDLSGLAAADAARKLQAHAVLAGLKVEFPAPVGTKWFTSSWEPSDVAAANCLQKVASWGPVSEILGAGDRFSAAAGAVTIRDDDGTVRGWWEDHQFQRLPGELRWAVFTPGQAHPATTAAVEILACSVVPPLSWREGDRAIALEISDLSIRNQKKIGYRATPDLLPSFPDIAEDDVGRVIPLVYGRPQRVRAIDLTGGPTARLAEAIADDTLEFTVDDAAGFAEGESIYIRVGREIMEGSFSGNTFTATTRGKVFHQSNTTSVSEHYCKLIDSTLYYYADNWFVGLFLEVIPDRRYGGNSIRGFEYTCLSSAADMIQVLRPPDFSQAREIIRFSTPDTIEFAAPFTIEGVLSAQAGSTVKVEGRQIRLLSGTAYKIRSIAEPHNAGDQVRLWHNAVAEYAIGMGTCTACRVYVHGYKRPPSAWNYSRTVLERVTGSWEAFLRAQAQERGLEPPPEPDWVPLPPEFWDVTTRTHGEGPTFSTVQLSRRPTDLPGWFIDTDEIRVDVVGPEGSGGVYVNPSDIIADILSVYGGLSGDGPSFAAAKSSLANWKMNFALAEEVDLLDLCADLAMQARCRIRWLEDEPELLYQAVDGGSTDLAVATSRMMLDSLERSREEVELAYSQVLVSWLERGKRKKHLERNAAAESVIGRRELAIDAWAYGSEHCPKKLARFFLDRSRHLHDLARLDATVFAVAAEPGDTVTLDRDGLLPDEPVKGQLLEAVFDPGRAPEPPAAVGMNVKLYHWAGCSLACEGTCETMGCETACESYFEPAGCWSCETACECACELGCTAAAEFLCADHGCQAACMAGCEVLCQAAQMVGAAGEWGCGACEAACQAGCESACEAGCESVCEAGCESECEMECETGFETG